MCSIPQYSLYIGNVIRILAKRQFFLKNTQVIENLAKIDTVVFDKTGTITNTEKSEAHFQGDPLEESEQIAIRSLAHQSNHPVSQKIDAYFGALPIHEVKDFEEIEGKGIRGYVDGLFVQIEKAPAATAISVNGRQKGRFLVSNSYRTGLQSLIAKWRNKFKLFLLSGDNDQERTNLSSLFHPENLFFRQSPKDKLTFIKGLQENEQKVLMIGDGLNDAGALRQSEVGIVIAENTNNFTPACDAIIDARQFDQLPQFMALAKGSIKLIYVAYLLAFIYNVIGLSFAVQGLLSPVIAAILMPLSSVTIVVFGLLSSSYLGKRMMKDYNRITDNYHPSS